MINYFINFVCFNRFEKKDVWYDVQQIRLHRDDQTFCYISKIGRHWVIKYNAFFEPINFAVFVVSTEFLFINEMIEMKWHAMFNHFEPKTIQHLKKTMKNVQIIKSKTAPVMKKCKICVFIKAHWIMFRRPGHKEFAVQSFDKIEYDLIQQNETYNLNNWISYFICFFFKMEFVYTHFRKNNVLNVIKIFLNMIKIHYNQIVQFIHIDDESILKTKFNELFQNENIIQKRTALYTPDQNDQIKRFEKIVILRIKVFRIFSRLSTNLWLKIYKIINYINNRISRKIFEWKTPFKVFHEKKLNLSHFYFYECRTYFLRFKILRKNKLKFRVLINYFVKYDSTNIFRIWIFNKKKII